MDYSGSVDSVDGNRISGWARCGESQCSVDIFLNDALILTVAANLFRFDLKEPISQDGKRAFLAEIPPIHCDGKIKILRLCFAGTDILVPQGEREFCHSFRYAPASIVMKPDPALALRARTMLSLLRPMDVIDQALIRRGRPHDGGYVMLDAGLENAVAYSLGINDDVSWDLDMAVLGCQLFQYDHTIDALPHRHPSFHWFKQGIAGSSSADGLFQSIDDLLRRNGHAGRRDLILKMDIEGAEWEVLQALPPPNLVQFSQIVAEFHDLAEIDDDAHYERLTGALRKLHATHRLVHIHANNWGPLAVIGGVPLPDVIEVTYVRAQDHHFTECKRIFPTELDQPNRVDVADFYLGPMGQNEAG